MFTIKILMVLRLELLRDTVIENKWAHRVSESLNVCSPDGMARHGTRIGTRMRTQTMEERRYRREIETAHLSTAVLA